jgi:glycosyltransferase involved in cell wall biosynthesis
MAAILSGRPNVITIHGNMRVHARRPEHKGSLYYQMAALLEAFALKRTHGVVAISRYTQTLVSPFARRTWLIPNAVDPRFFDITLLQPPVPRVLFVGSMDPRKNPLGLLEACTPLLETGQCTLALAGQLDDTSAYGAAFHQLANQLPNIEFLGFLNRDALAQEFSKSSILVLPTFEDNCPMVVLEAMAAGLPVAASRVGGIPDLISDGIDGLMFDPSQPEAIRSTLETLIHQPSLRSTIGQEAKRKALGHFHPKVIAQQHLDLYRECLNHTAI